MSDNVFVSNSDVKLVEDNIQLRLEQKIYAFTTNTIPKYLKVGDTSRGVDLRISEWEKILKERIKNKQIIIKKEKDWPALIDGNENLYFRDYAVHKFLKSIGLKPLDNEKLLKLYSQEFFKNATVKNVDDAIKEINKVANDENPIKEYDFYRISDSKSADFHYKNDKIWHLRPNQKKAVDEFLIKRKSEKSLLLYAVMRFGKSFTAMQCALKAGFSKILIVSAKADVKGEWKQTIEKPECFKDFNFICDDDLKKGIKLEDLLTKKDKNKIVVFLTLQNLYGRASDGKSIKKRLEQVFKKKFFEFLIIDETHYGAWSDALGSTISDDVNDVSHEISEKKSFDEKIKKIKVGERLHLSGTPYQLLYNEKFDTHNIISTCQFKDIINDKEKWDRDNLINIETGVLNPETGFPYEEFDNPYFGFPKMLRFAFNLPESTKNKLLLLAKKEKISPLLSLFETKDNNGSRYFVHEEDVLNLFKSIDGSENCDGILSFLDIPKIKNNDVCKHIVVVLPRKHSCDALEALLKKNKKKFKNLKNYDLVNISGFKIRDEFKGNDSVDNIKKYISLCEKNKKKTITLTVHKMLTGTTVKEWDTMIMLKNTQSAQEYDQAIFRIQNQYVIEYEEINSGRILKKDMKPQTILVDFDPLRMFQLQGDSTRIVNLITGKDEIDESLKDELNYFPIIAYNGKNLVKVESSNIVKIITNYNKQKSLIDESNSIVRIDENISNDKFLNDFISSQSSLDLSNKLLINPIKDGKKKDIEIPAPNSESKTGKDSGSTSEVDSSKAEMLKKYRMCIIGLLFYSFLTKSTINGLKSIVNSLTKKSEELNDNKRIFKNLNLSLKFVKRHLSFCSRVSAFSIDGLVKKANILSKDTSLSEKERALNALARFSKISDAEIVTPNTACLKVLEAIGKDRLISIINNGGKILDIASKTGEFAFAIYSYLEGSVNLDILKKSIFSIPTSSTTYEFVRKIYNVLNMPIENIADFNSLDLIDAEKGILKTNCIRLINKFVNGSKNKNKRSKNMVKFDVVVGNPPYQETKKEATEGNNKNTIDIYPEFQKLSLMISDVTCLIYPGKEYLRGKKNTLDKHLHYLRIYNGSSRSGEKHIPDEDSIFGDSVRRIPGDVAIVLYDKTEEKEKVIYQDIEIDRTDLLLPVRKEFISIASKLNKYAKTFSFSKVSKVCESNFIQYNKKSILSKKVDRKKPSPKGYSKVLTNDRAGSGGKANWYYIKTADLDRNEVLSYKIIIASARPNESFPNSLEIINKDESFGRTKLAIYDSNDFNKTNCCFKYLSTRFAQVINCLTPDDFLYYLPDFEFVYNKIDWSKSIEDIDLNLFNLFGFTKKEIELINKNFPQKKP